MRKFENPETKVSSIVRSAIRIARLVGDDAAAYRFQMEMNSYFDTVQVLAAKDSIIAALPSKEAPQIINSLVEDFLSERDVSFLDNKNQGTVEKKVQGLSIPEIEHLKERAREGLKERSVKPVSASDRREIYELDGLILRFSCILDRVKQRTFDYLSGLEKRLLFEEMTSGIFEQNRLMVDELLKRISPELFQQMKEVYERAKVGTSEAKAHALLSCRRILKAAADILYPPKSDPVIGEDGKEHIVDDAKFKNRLEQFVRESKAGDRSKKMLLVQLDDALARINALNDLSSKGVHDQVTTFELNQAVIQTYLLIGDLFNLRQQ